MTKYHLKLCSPFINPFWYRNSRGSFETVVFDNKIKINSEELTFTNNIRFIDGTPVVVFISDDFYCYLKSEYEEYKLEKQRKIEEEKEKEKEKRNKKREIANEYYKNLHLPFPYEVCHKDNLSGLSLNSWGDGRKNNTVEHIVVLEDIHIGKLKRNKGDFLCTTEGGSNGKMWIDDNRSTAVDGNNDTYTPIITCKTCLKLIKNLQ